MKIEMQFRADAVCPKDGETISMDVELEIFSRFVLVEDVLAMVAMITSKPIFQEEFTRRLKDGLAEETGNPGRIGLKTVGTHSGVKIICSA